MKKMIIIKVGGRVIGDTFNSFYQNLKEISINEKLVIIHGASKDVNEFTIKMGNEPKIITSPSGFKSRYTDKDTIKLFQMVVAGKINKNFISKLQSVNINAIGLSGMDAQIIKAKRKTGIKSLENGKIKEINDDYTGKIRRIEVDVLKHLLNFNLIPVLAPIAMGQEFEPLNIDGDRLAAMVAGGIGGKILIIFTDVEGVYINQKIVPIIKYNDLKDMLTQVSGGMKKKLLSAKEAIDLGVEKVIIASILKEDPLKSALKGDNCSVIIK